MAQTRQPLTVALLPRLRAVVLVALTVALLLCAPSVASLDAPFAARAAALGLFVALLVWWVRWCGSERLPAAGLPLEVLATAVVLIAVPDPLHALGIVVLAVKFRSLYPGWVRSLVFTAGVAGVTALGLGVLARRPADTGSFVDTLLLLIAVPTVMLITQIVATAVAQRDISIGRERELAESAVAIAGTVDRTKIADIATAAAIRMMPAQAGVSAQLAPAGYGEPHPEDGLALAVPGRNAKAAFLVVRVSGGVPSEARHALTALAETVGLGLTNADAFDMMRSRTECDPLTGLPNRSAFTSRLRLAVDDARARQHSLRGPTGLWIIMVDLDNFRHVNSMWGHETGDRVLVMIANRLMRCVRQNDVVARLGGDEFAILVSASGASDRGEQVADRIHAALREAIEVPSVGAIRTSGSLGMGRWESGMTADDLLSQADEAMYRAKQPEARLALTPQVNGHHNGHATTASGRTSPAR